MLETQGLTKYFGGLCAVNRLRLTIQAGEIVGLIGPNGAGKTTVFNLLTGFLKPTEGSVVFEGKNVTGEKPHSIAKLGVVRTFQIAKSFKNFTVLHNLRAASHLYAGIGLGETIFRTPGYWSKEAKSFEHALEVLRIVGLETWKDEIAGILPHGHQKLLGIAMALAPNPKLLLLDEPLAGMNPKEVNRALEVMNKIRSLGITILLIEHNMRALMSVCDRVVVLNFGQKIGEGSPEEVKRDENVIKAYLGAGAYGNC